MKRAYPEILTLIQAAELLQISERTLQRIVKKGEVPGIQVGGQWRFDREQLRELVRGEWQSPPEGETGRELVEKESLRLGVEIPEAFHDLQQAAAKRLHDAADEGEGQQ
jgi:excisionase family DNA binding protein